MFGFHENVQLNCFKALIHVVMSFGVNCFILFLYVNEPIYEMMKKF